jgi:hypothetical protein
VLDVSTGAISQLSYQKRPVDGISPNRKLLLLGSGLDGLAIANANTGKFLETPWDIRARNVFLKQESRVAGVIVSTDGAVQAYSSVPELLPNSFRSQQALGDPQSVVCQSNHAVVCASFADGSILEFSTTDEGIQNPLLHRLDGTKKAAPDLLELSNNLLLVSRQGRLAIYDLKTKSLIELPRRGLRGGKFVTYQDQLSVLTVDSFGQLEAWSDQGQLLANASLPIQKDSGNPLLRPKYAGVSILVSRNADTAYTTFGNQIYAWSLPDLALSWRSPEIAATSELLTLRRLSEAEDLIVVTDQSVFKSDQTFTKVHTVSLPTTVPSIDDAGSYLSNVAGINVVEGRVIRN